MPRCCITTCISGTFKDERQRKATGQRSAAFFSFPKDENLLKIWKETLYGDAEKTVENNDKVCELHFNEKNITKYDETILKDGSVHRLARKRYTLDPKAIPVSNAKRRKTHEKQSVFRKNGSFQVQNKCAVSQRNSRNIIKKTYSTDTAKENVNVKVNEKVTDPLQNSQFKEVFIKKEIIEQVNEESLDLKLEESNEFYYDNSSQDETSVEIPSKSNLLAEKCKVFDHNLSFNVISTADYSFSRLKDDLDTKNLNISGAWAHVFQDDVVTFVYIHPLKLSIQCFCIVDCQMKIKIATADKRVVKDANVEINKKTDFINFLTKLQRTICCDGMGIDERFSSDCLGFITTESEFIKLRGLNRCNPCRNARKKLIKKKNSNLSDLEIQLHQQNRKIEELTFNCNKMQKLLNKKT